MLALEVLAGIFFNLWMEPRWLFPSVSSLCAKLGWMSLVGSYLTDKY